MRQGPLLTGLRPLGFRLYRALGFIGLWGLGSRVPGFGSKKVAPRPTSPTLTTMPPPPSTLSSALVAVDVWAVGTLGFRV